MRIFRTVHELISYLKSNVWGREKLGFVPTMGAIHEGHLSLVKASQKDCQKTLVSVFVNPAQFNNSQDFEKYPVRESQDIQLLESVGCDYLFMPDAEEIYPEENFLKIDFGQLERVLEGEFRPGHFSGVGIIISKFFHLVNPEIAYFGQKDIQQVAIIKKLVRDLNFQTEISVVETMREPSGLAMSSRNLRLSADGLGVAAEIYSLEKELRAMLLEGRAVSGSVDVIKGRFREQDKIDLEYLEVIDTTTFESIDSLEGLDEVSICVAAHVEGVRLIDNIYVKRK